jgi:UDP-N-acetylglucosamine diphosphorylase/glucosamine-1-phosphate N-acetyltransferase
MAFVVLFDEEKVRINLLPLTFTRPVCEIRIGILTLREKWEMSLNTTVSYLTQNYLSAKFPLKGTGEGLFINGSISPSQKLLEAVKSLINGQALYQGGKLVALRGTVKDIQDQTNLDKIQFNEDLSEINHLWDIFQKNGAAILSDFKLITANKKTQPLSDTVTVIGDKNLVFLEAGARAEACILNTTAGPIYLGKDAEIMEGSAVRGPFSLGEHSALKLNTKIYGPTTVGPQCKVGGEVSNSVLFGYSNKAHDGFLGNSVIGEWCNLGADSNNSNLKNNYGNVKLYHYGQKKQVDTGLQFCGLIMGDHSKCGINTMFNTGTVVGVGSNIYGGGFPPTHIPEFSWGGADGFEPYQLDKLFATAERVYERRGLKFDQVEKDILKAVKEGK